MTRFSFILALFVSSLIGFSQEVLTDAQKSSESSLKFLPTLNLGTLVNFQDIYIDFGAGAFETKTKLGAQLNFAFRPYYKKVQIYEEANVIRQWKEKKYCLNLDVYKKLLEFHIAKTNTHFLLGVKTGYLFGDYRGTRQRPAAGFTFNPYAGISLNLNGIHLALAYQYFNDHLASVPDSRFLISFTILLNE